MYRSTDQIESKLFVRRFIATVICCKVCWDQSQHRRFSSKRIPDLIGVHRTYFVCCEEGSFETVGCDHTLGVRNILATGDLWGARTPVGANLTVGDFTSYTTAFCDLSWDQVMAPCAR